MPEPLTTTALAGAALSLVAPYLAEAARAGAAKAGEAAIGGVGALWSALRARLTTPAAAEAAQDLAAHPDEPDVQAAARRQILKALEADDAWRAEIAALVERLGGPGRAGDLRMTLVGDDSVGSQVAGDGNQVSIRGRGEGT